MDDLIQILDGTELPYSQLNFKEYKNRRNARRAQMIKCISRAALLL